MNKNKNFVACAGGRHSGVTKRTIADLTEQLNKVQNAYRHLSYQYNDMVTTHNALVDAHDGLLSFLKMQCGILYTAITGDVKVDDPLKDISILTLPSDGNKDLADYRQGICIYVKTYEETMDPAKAFEAYQNYLGGIM